RGRNKAHAVARWFSQSRFSVSQETRRMSKKKTTGKTRVVSRARGPWVWAIFLFGAALLAYAYWFSVPLVFDDLQTIQRSGIRFGEFYWNLLSARAVLYLTFTLNYMLSGQDVWTYHLFNFLLHLANGLLIFFLGERILSHADIDGKRSRQFAALAAAF